MAKSAGNDGTVVIKMLANPRRRMFLQAIASRDNPVLLNTLVDDVMRLEDGDWDDCSKYRNSVRVSLRQNHIETLEDNNLIHYDEEKDHIKRGTEFYKIQAALDSFDKDSSQDISEPPDDSVELQYTESDQPSQDQNGRLNSESLLILLTILLVIIASLFIYSFA